jgi:hypothetical protein
MTCRYNILCLGHERIYEILKIVVNYAFYVGIRRIVVGVMTSCGMESPGFISRQERGIFSSLKPVDQIRGPTTFVKGTGC